MKRGEIGLNTILHRHSSIFFSVTLGKGFLSFIFFFGNQLFLRREVVFSSAGLPIPNFIEAVF